MGKIVGCRCSQKLEIVLIKVSNIFARHFLEEQKPWGTMKHIEVLN